MGINKVQYGNTVLIDLTDTTAVASDVAVGKYFYGKDGVKTLGTGGGSSVVVVTEEPDTNGGIIKNITAVDISDTTAAASDVAQGKYFYTADGIKTAGTASGGGATFPASFTIKKSAAMSSQTIMSRPILDTDTGEIRIQTLTVTTSEQTVELCGTKYATAIWQPIISVQYSDPLTITGCTNGAWITSTTYQSGSVTRYLYHIPVANGDDIVLSAAS